VSKSGPLVIGLDLGDEEQNPSTFLECIRLAEQLKFKVAWLGDHFMPWVDMGKRSSFVWALIAASLQTTHRIKVGPYVTCPIGGRYHPAIIAQASATLDNLYPRRFLLAVGTGEAINEEYFLGYWPKWNERLERLTESLRLIRELWNEDGHFDFQGKYFPAKQIFLYTKPKTPIGIYFSATGPRSAFSAGKHGDHLITLSSINPLERCRTTIFPRFDEGVRSAGKDPRKAEKIVSVRYTFDDEKEFLEKSRRRAAIMTRVALDEADPREIERLGLSVADADLLKRTNFCSDWNDLIEILNKFHDIGATQVTLPSGADRVEIEKIAKHVLPSFSGS